MTVRMERKRERVQVEGDSEKKNTGEKLPRECETQQDKSHHKREEADNMAAQALSRDDTNVSATWAVRTC